MKEKAPRNGLPAEGALSDGELKARLAQAELHFSHYRWDDAIAAFEAVLAAQRDHPAATQGWANAVEQKSIDEELGLALSKARASLAEHRFDEALTMLNHAQARGALSHILKYHSEIDGLRSEAQEGQEWQRRIDGARREAESLAARRRFDQALEVLDNTLRPLSGRGWERLGSGLATLRDRLWAERDVSERVQFAEATYEQQDYRLASELAGALREELPEREDVRRLHERARGAWGRVRDQLGAVDDALAQERTDDALALLAALRAEHPRNPDWQAIALRVHMDQGRREVAAGRAAMVEHEFDAAAETFERGHAAFATTVEIFPGHPTAAAEQAEALALRNAALSAAQARRDRAAFRWEATRQGWLASRDQLAKAIAVRDRDFGEVVALLDAMLGEAQAAVVDLEQARLLLAEGRQALDVRDAGGARDALRAGLARIEGGPWGAASEATDLRERLAAALREADRVQRDVKKLLSQAEAAKSGARAGERLRLLRLAHEKWETAPGLAARLADELLAAASERSEAGDEEEALALCEQVRELTGAPAGALTASEQMIAALHSRRDARAALADAAARIEAASRAFPPSAEGFSSALAVLAGAAPAFAEAVELAPELDTLQNQARTGRDRALAALPHLARSDARAAAGDWRGAAAALGEAHGLLGSLAGPELTDQLSQFRARAAAVEASLAPALASAQRAEEAMVLAADGDLDTVDWNGIDRDLAAIRKALRAAPELPSPLPAEWEAMKVRAERITRRGKVLRGVHEKIRGGRAVDAIPVLQSEATASGDPVVLAVLARLLEQTAADAATVARGWLSQAVAALSRGELGTTEAYLELANSYLPAAPQVSPEVRRVERQVAALGLVRSAVVEGRALAARGEFDGALVCYRQALEQATGGETGLASEARAKLNRLLGLEDEFASTTEPGAAQGPGRAIVDALLDPQAADPLLSEYVVPALGPWWRLACRTASTGYVTAQIALGRDAAAVGAGARLLEQHPRDRAALELYVEAEARSRERLLSRGRRRLERARRLAASGAYDLALAEISAESLALTPWETEMAAPRDEELEVLAGEAADFRLELQHLRSLSEHLKPLLVQMREQALTGAFEHALAARTHAEFLDPRHRAAPLWEDLDALAALIAQRQASPVSPPPPLPAPNPENGQPQSGDYRRPPPEVAALPAVAQTVERAAPDEPPGVPVPATPEEKPVGSLALPTENAPAPIATTPATHAPVAPVGPQQEPWEPAAPFDLDDWLSNVTALSPEDGEPGNE